MIISPTGWLRKNIKGDYHIWGVVLFFSIMSIAVVYSATGTMAYQKLQSTEYYLFKHGALVALGLACMWIAHRFNYIYYARLSRFGMWLSVPLLLWAYFKGTNLNEASRWITIPLINQTFQPSDLAKLALISNLAAMLAKRQHIKREEYDPSILTNMIIWIGLICACIVLSNASTAALLAATCFLLMYIGRVPMKYLAGMVIFCIIMGSFALLLGQRAKTSGSRLTNYWETFNGRRPPEFQVEQSYIALAHGGIYGQGPGNSHQRNYLPHSYSDFIFAMIVEEYGLIGGVVIIMAYLYLLWRGMRAIRKANRAYGGLLSAGLTFSIVIQAMINMAVSVGLVPVTGQPLPLLSMGGTSLLFTGTAIGIIISVSRGEADESNLMKTA
ncbi:cell division protein FtsW [Larkinella arboricola]|uniref:Probable peptidoglycan glycosyltransferase FtsW n=1 Tax=Larkinella arboricola TaxID=643671 RepID=A0A327WXI7_LARAB|nr:FtsW/RodA/SpoVE family cell cycle protein [Larkinella arboricola]RAJ98017.1 cell division protein FtsW [Larkinella arboricola]